MSQYFKGVLLLSLGLALPSGAGQFGRGPGKGKTGSVNTHIGAPGASLSRPVRIKLPDLSLTAANPSVQSPTIKANPMAWAPMPEALGEPFHHAQAPLTGINTLPGAPVPTLPLSDILSPSSKKSLKKPTAESAQGGPPKLLLRSLEVETIGSQSKGIESLVGQGRILFDQGAANDNDAFVTGQSPEVFRPNRLLSPGQIKTPLSEQSVGDLLLRDVSENHQTTEDINYAAIYRHFPLTVEEQDVIDEITAGANPLNFDLDSIEVLLDEKGITRPEPRLALVASLAAKYGIAGKSIRNLPFPDGEKKARGRLKRQSAFLNRARVQLTQSKAMRGLSDEQAWAILGPLAASGVRKDLMPKIIETAIGRLGRKSLLNLPDASARLSDVFNDSFREVLLTFRATDLTQDLFARTGRSFARDRPTMRQVLASVERARKNGHTLPANDYIERHMTGELMRFILDNESVDIEVYDGPAGYAARELSRRGYTQLRRLSDNQFTDFKKFIAHDPARGKAVIVIVAPSGSAYRSEVLSHLLYYSLNTPRGPPRRIDPARIKVFSALTTYSSRAQFAAILNDYDLDPDILILGNTSDLARKMKVLGIKPRRIQGPNFTGYQYDWEGRSILSVALEPYLYADRTGSFMNAVAARSDKARSVLLLGTAGGLDDAIAVNDLVVPDVLSRANGLESYGVTGFTNHAAGLLQEAGLLSKKGVHSKNARQGTVDSILVEDKRWLAAHSSGRKRLSIVEQEGTPLALAIRGKPIKAYMAFRVSDHLSDQGADFTANEIDRPLSHAEVRQTDVLDAFLAKMKGSASQSRAPPRPAVFEGSVNVRAREGRFVVTAPQGKFEVRIDGVKEFLTADQAGDFGFLIKTGLEKVLATEGVGLGLRIAKYAMGIEERYGMKVRVTTL